MPSNSFRIGVARVQLSVSTSTALPSLSAVTFTAAAVTPTTTLINDIKLPLPAATYNVIVALVGEDKTNGGYSVGVGTAASANVVLTAGQGILVTILNADFPANMGKAACAAIFLKQGSADYQLADFAYIDPTTDFKHVVVAKPLITAPFFTAALLNAATADDTLGDRTPTGYDYVNLTPTTGGVQVTRDVTTVTVSPDNTPDFDVATARSTTIAFQLLPNDVLDVVRASAGNYVKYTSGVVIEEAQQSLATAVAKLIGNKPFKLIMPPDSSGYSEVRLYLGGLIQNQVAFTENWQKAATTPIQYTFATAIQDRLLVDEHVEVIYKRRG